MKTVSKILMGAATFFFVGTAAAQTEYDQDKKHKDKDKSTSEMHEMHEGQQKEQDFSSYDLDQDGQISEDEFATAYAQNTTTDSSDQYESTGQQEGVTGAEEGVTGQEQEGVAGQTQTGETDEYVAEIFETIDEDSNGYVDQTEFQSWTSSQGK